MPASTRREVYCPGSEMSLNCITAKRSLATAVWKSRGLNRFKKIDAGSLLNA